MLKCHEFDRVPLCLESGCGEQLGFCVICIKQCNFWPIKLSLCIIYQLFGNLSEQQNIDIFLIIVQY